MTARLRDGFDALLVDLDGTVYRGGDPIPHAVETLSAGDVPVLYVTNNASRRPGEVADQLVALGLSTSTDDVVTSAQAAGRLLADQLEEGAAVLVVGTPALAEEVERVGLTVCDDADRAHAVVQGHSPVTGWAQLSEACLAIRSGALWVAANTDATLVVERGIVPGNGAMVAALRAATGAEPLVAGKPARPLMEESVRRAASRTPLVVGDRLDTDVAGAVAIGAASLFVLTGVHDAFDLLAAPPAQRPTFVAADLRALEESAQRCAPGPVVGWTADWDGDAVVLRQTHGAEDPIDALRATCAVAWQRDSGAQDVRAEGAAATAALRAWGRVLD